MNTLHNVGKQVSSFELYDQLDPITGIWLFVGENRDEDLYKAGNETGTVLEVYCPYGNQTMANTLLSQLQGQVYAGFRAQNAVLSPAAELGDWVTVNGGTYMLAYRSINFGPGHMAEIAAPGESTQEHEYGWTSPETRKTTYNQARSMISKTNKEIQLAIYGEDGKGGLNGRMNTFTMGLSSISTEIKGYKDTVNGYEEQLALYEQDLEGYSGKVSKYTEDVNGYKEQVLSFEGSVEGFEQRVALYQEQDRKTQEAYSLIDQKVNNITLQVTNNDATASIQLVVNGENQGAPVEIEMNGLVSFNDLKKGSTTTIHGGLIDTDSIYANSLHLGGKMDVYKTKTGDTKGGFIGYFAGWESTKGIGMMESETTGQVICTDKAVRISHGNNSQVICMDDYLELRGVTAVRFGLPSGYLEGEDDSMPEDYDYYARLDKETFRPYEDRAIALGNASNQWTMLWAESCTCCPSDINKKNSVETLPDKYLQMFDLITPKRFKMNNGTSGRYHVGYIAQEVKAAMDSVGLRSTDFAGWIMDTDAEGNAVYFLRYEEFGAIYAAKIKQLEARLERLEETA